MISNLLRVGGCRLQLGAERGGGGCIYVFLFIIRNKNKKIVKTYFPNNFLFFSIIVLVIAI
jgi:hypothetical protein